jgi:DNA-binding GntR family transcriptional regulator
MAKPPAIPKRRHPGTEAYPFRWYGRKRDQAYVYIKRHILNRQWPPGSTVDLEAVARTLSISRTPIQEAVARLELEGLLEVVPQVGVYVREFTFREMEERLIARAALEGVLAEFCARRAPDEDLEKLERWVAEMATVVDEPEEYAAWNRRLHFEIHRLAEMPQIALLAEQYWDTLEYAASIDVLFSPNPSQSLQEHRQIVQYLRARLPRRARQAMERHVRRVATLIARHERRAQPDQALANQTSGEGTV